MGHGRGTPQHRDPLDSSPAFSQPSPLLSQQCPCQAGLQGPQVSSMPHPAPASLLQDCLCNPDFSFLARVSSAPRAAGCGRCPTAAGTGSREEHPRTLQFPPAGTSSEKRFPQRARTRRSAPGASLHLPKSASTSMPLPARPGPAGLLCSPPLLALQEPGQERMRMLPLSCDTASSKGLQPSSDVRDLPGRSVDTMISVFVMLNSAA